ncbi:MAG: hypothetical protein VB092_08555 [Oscillospiraceae bacterium]|nr:hypothetical protein [Oscillospiraceae bacterium]
MNEKRTELTVYAGTHTIGGVIFAVTCGKDRVLMEMGAAYDPARDVCDGVVEPRRVNWLADKLRLGSLPTIDGLFGKKDLAGFDGVVSYEDSDWNTAVFITHLHLDHMAHIGAVAPQIPVYMHKNAQIIERALETTGEGVDNNGRNYTDLIPNEWISVGDIKVLPVLTGDVSYYDFAFLIKTPDGGVIHWTGDLTLHGECRALSVAQMELLERENVDVLLCDCTSFMDSVLGLMYDTKDPRAILPSPDVPAGMLSTPAFYDALGEKLADIRGLCVFNYYQREMYDAEKFLQWADRCGRKCCFEPDAAYIVYKFFNIKPYVYIPDSARYAEGGRAAWVDELLAHATVVTPDELRANPAGYMVQNSSRHILELFSLPNEGGVYLHADGLPIGAFDPAYGKMRSLVDRAGFAYVTFFCENYFGHGYPCQVKYFVDRVNPRVLIPCHSYNPERLLPRDGVQLIPEEGATYILTPGEGLCKKKAGGLQ